MSLTKAEVAKNKLLGKNTCVGCQYCYFVFKEVVDEMTDADHDIEYAFCRKGKFAAVKLPASFMYPDTVEECAKVLRRQCSQYEVIATSRADARLHRFVCKEQIPLHVSIEHYIDKMQGTSIISDMSQIEYDGIEKDYRLDAQHYRRYFNREFGAIRTHIYGI